MDKNLLWRIESINRLNGDPFDPVDSIFTLYRIFRLRNEKKLNASNPDDFYSRVQNMPGLSRKYKGTINALLDISYLLKHADTRTMFEYIDHILCAYKRGGVPVLPASLCDIMFKKIKGNNKKIFIPDCDVFGTSLYNLMCKYPNNRYYTTCANEELRVVYEYLYKDLDVEFLNADIYHDNYSNIRFDIVVSFPVMGGRAVIGRGGFISRDPALIATQNLLYNLNMDGELTIILPAKVTFGIGDMADFRKYIQSNYKIKEICSLPPKTFMPYMALSTYLFRITNGVTEDVVIKKYDCEKSANKDGEIVNALKLLDEKLLFVDEFENIGNWNIDMVFSSDDEDIISYKESRVKKIALGEIADVFRGKAITGKSEDGKVAVVNISNINEFGIDVKNLDAINEDVKRVDRYLLKKGDVLITSRGTTVKVAVFNSCDKPCIVSSNINVIRPGKMILGTYLKLFFETKAGQKMIKALQRGDVIVNINYSDIKTLEVPVPPLNEQKMLVEEYNKGLSKYKKAIKAAEDDWSETFSDIKKRLY